MVPGGDWDGIGDVVAVAVGEQDEVNLLWQREGLGVAGIAGNEGIDENIGSLAGLDEYGGVAEPGDALNGKGLGQLHLDVVAIGDVESAMRRLLALGAGVTEGQHLAARIGGLEEARHNWLNQRFRQIIECGPEEHHIELALGEAERLIEKAFDIPDGAAVFGFALPLAG